MPPGKSIFRLQSRVCLSQFVPRHAPMTDQELLVLDLFLLNSQRLFVLTGAGVSTESGIKDYRSEGVGLFATTSHRPTSIADFLRSVKVRQRYWARNTVAWPMFSAFSPNTSHHFLANLEKSGRLHWLVTQNVDRLHQKAGSRLLTELHGSMYTVSCLSCRHSECRAQLQERIVKENPSWSAVPRGFAPDADVFVSEEAVQSFRTPVCQKCGGDLKPDVVFFGDSVPKERVNLVNQRLAEADACLVLGTSLHTFSALRHVRVAQQMALPVLILNIGPTRADPLVNVRLRGRCGEAFDWLAKRHHWTRILSS